MRCDKHFDQASEILQRQRREIFHGARHHHDNLDLWNSKYQPWNSVNVGSHKDLIGGWAEADPEQAAIMAVEHLPPGRLQQDVVISILERWAQQQPEAAIAWANQFPTRPLRDIAMENIRAQIQRPTELD